MIAVLATHPIQYQAPLWRLIAERGRAPIKVYYLSQQGLAARRDPGFGHAVAWDIDLTGGYSSEFAPCFERSRQDSFFWLSLKDNLPRRMRADGARALWVQGWQTLAYWQAASLARGAGLELWLRGDTNQRSAGRGWPQRFATAALFSRVDRFLCVGAANRAYFLARGVPAERLALAPHSVDNARFAAATDALRGERARLRRKFGAPDGAFCVAFVGKLVARKRPFDLVDAVRALNARGGGRPAHLLFVGDGALREALARDCPEASQAGFLNQSEIAEAYVAADCLALPSDASETWGLVVNEAMAAGLPVVLSRSCGAADDLVTPHWPALTHRCGDAWGLAAALDRVRADPPSSAALRAVVDRHSLLRTAEAIERLYAEIPRNAPAAQTLPLHASEPRQI